VALRGQTWISTHEGFPLTGVLQAIAALSGEPPIIAHRVNEFFVAAQIVRAGAAIAVMPRFTRAPGDRRHGAATARRGHPQPSRGRARPPRRAGARGRAPRAAALVDVAADLAR
jgi:DNA-binding transcriptional LysR family regulator